VGQAVPDTIAPDAEEERTLAVTREVTNGLEVSRLKAADALFSAVTAER